MSQRSKKYHNGDASALRDILSQMKLGETRLLHMKRPLIYRTAKSMGICVGSYKTGKGFKVFVQPCK